MNHDVFLPTPLNVIVLILCGHQGKNKVTFPHSRVTLCCRELKGAQKTPGVNASRTRRFHDRRGNVPETLGPALTSRHRARIVCGHANGFRPDRPDRHVRAPRYLTHERGSLCAVRHLPNHDWPPPAHCSLPHCIFPCRLLHNSAENADGSLQLLRGLQLAPYKRGRVRAQSLPSSSFMFDRKIVPRSTTLDLRLMVCLPTLST